MLLFELQEAAEPQEEILPPLEVGSLKGMSYEDRLAIVAALQSNAVPTKDRCNGEQTWQVSHFHRCHTFHTAADQSFHG